MTEEIETEEIETVIPEVMPNNEIIPIKSKVEDLMIPESMGMQAFVFSSNDIKVPNADGMKTVALAAIIGGGAMVALGMLLLAELNKNKPLSSSKPKLEGHQVDIPAIEGGK